MAQDLPPWRPRRSLRRPALGLALGVLGLPVSLAAAVVVFLIAYRDGWEAVPPRLLSLLLLGTMVALGGLGLLLGELMPPGRLRGVAAITALLLAGGWGLGLPLALLYLGLVAGACVYLAGGAYTLLLRWLESHGRP